ncbi:hypothetical protein GJ496_003287 [Pomphorhynchus laevis]|nr:hypothetical protein GJ496_003287 [Pomphorhynchus laevis]
MNTSLFEFEDVLDQMNGEKSLCFNISAINWILGVNGLECSHLMDEFTDSMILCLTYFISSLIKDTAQLRDIRELSNKSGGASASSSSKKSSILNNSLLYYVINERCTEVNNQLKVDSIMCNIIWRNN